VVPDEPGFHLLQQQGRLGRQQVGCVERVDGLVLDLLDEVERSPAAVEATENCFGERDRHEDLSC
jgi:hypothetical protein